MMIIKWWRKRRKKMILFLWLVVAYLLNRKNHTWEKKNFKWPERKADAMRVDAIKYRGIKLLENEIFFLMRMILPFYVELL